MEALPPNFNHLTLPCVIPICGPSQVGKSTFLLNLLKHKDIIFNEDFKRICYISPTTNKAGVKNQFYQKLLEVCAEIEFLQELPSMAALTNGDPWLLILDDFQVLSGPNKRIHDFAIHDSHHYKKSIIYTTQNLYDRNVFTKTMQRSTTAYVVFRTAADQTNHFLSLQVFGKSYSNFITECLENLRDQAEWLEQQGFEEARYIVINIHPNKKASRFVASSNIFPSKKNGKLRPILYSKKK